MCSTNSGLSGTLVPYGLKIPTANPAATTVAAAAVGQMPGYPYPFASGISQAAFELHRSQLMEYNARVRYGIPYSAAAMASHGMPAGYHPNPHDPLAYLYGKHDPRSRFLHEEPKPAHSYIGLISMAILSSKDKKLVLSDIYQWILDNYNYFRTRGPGWRNSIRHNLSLNDCFIKSGRSANGKGHYWAIHPANIEDFKKGDFRRRRAQRKVRKAMGMAVPDDEDSPSPPPTSAAALHEWQTRMMGVAGLNDSTTAGSANEERKHPLHPEVNPMMPQLGTPSSLNPVLGFRVPAVQVSGKRRLFDVESLLAPDNSRCKMARHSEDLTADDTQDKAAGAGKLEDSETEREGEARVTRPDDPEEALIEVEEVREEGEDGDGELRVDVESDEGERDTSADLCPADRDRDTDTERDSFVCKTSASERVDSHRQHLPQTPTVQLVRTSTSSPGSDVSPGQSPTGSLGSSPISPQARGTHQPINPLQGMAGWPMGVPLQVWHQQERPSAFHSTMPHTVAAAAAAYGLPPHAYPLLAAPYPMPPGATLQGAMDSAQKWQETFSKIMARSYDKNSKLQS